MVKAEMTIEYNDKEQLHIGLDLLKREDWTEIEWQLANHLQTSLLAIIEVFKASGVKEIKREIINKSPQSK